MTRKNNGHFYAYASLAMFIAGGTLFTAYENHLTFKEAILDVLIPGLTISILMSFLIWLAARSVESKD